MPLSVALDQGPPVFLIWSSSGYFVIRSGIGGTSVGTNDLDSHQASWTDRPSWVSRAKCPQEASRWAAKDPPMATLHAQAAGNMGGWL